MLYVCSYLHLFGVLLVEQRPSARRPSNMDWAAICCSNVVAKCRAQGGEDKRARRQSC
jgi:hypothetical protein